jgi:hypothetical protein
MKIGLNPAIFKIRKHATPKRQYPYVTLHYVKTQKTPSFEVNDSCAHYISNTLIHRYSWSLSTGARFQVSPAVQVRSLLFWHVTHRRLVVNYRRLEASSPRRTSLITEPLKMGWTAYLKTSVTYNKSTLCNIPEERRSIRRCCTLPFLSSFCILQIENIWLMIDLLRGNW